MSKFSELSVQLDKALADVVKTKKDLDDATGKIQTLANLHQSALNTAQSLRQSIDNELNASLGTTPKSKIG